MMVAKSRLPVHVAARAAKGAQRRAVGVASATDYDWSLSLAPLSASQFSRLGPNPPFYGCALGVLRRMRASVQEVLGC